jgi:hypothetical protein
LEANRAVSLFIKLLFFHDNDSVQSSTLENSKTREKLVIKREIESYDFVTISRYPIGTNEEEWEKEMSQCKNIHNRRIEFDLHQN